jgi:hypothetical protein
MSLRSLTDLAVERDEKGGGDKTYTDALIHAIPSEVLALYTFLVTEIVGTIAAGDDKRLTLRWIVFAAGVAGTVLYLIVNYLRARDDARKRAFPGAEVFAAAVAFGAWGLVMPGSPLMSMLSSDNSRIWSAIITAAGVFTLGMLSGKLTRPAARAKQR